MRRSFLLIILAFLYNLSSAQTWQDTLVKIEKIFSRYQSKNPGAQLAISRNGELILSRAWGMADLEHNIPLTTESVTEAGSVSKQFTAACILLLEQEGKLSLEDDVRKYIPELPDYGYTITLRHMMQHTSGLRDWGSIAAMAGWPRSTKTYNNLDALYIASMQKHLNNKPGAEYIYSNTNYNLFAVLIERVSGMSLAEYSKKKIFDPANMKHTQWRDNYKKVVPNRAFAYSKVKGEYQTNMPNEYVYGNGGLLTTAEDLITWNNYYLSGKLGNPSLLEKQINSSAFNNGAMHNYAAGLFITKFRGWKLITHDGATASYRSNLDHFPAQGLSIAWLSNTSEFDRDTLDVSWALKELFFKDTSTAKPAAVVNYNIPAGKLERYKGWYRGERTGAGLLFTIKDGKLRSNLTGALRPVSENTFAVGTTQFIWNPDFSGFKAISPTNDTSYLAAVDSAVVNEKILAGYAGTYFSEEADARIFVSLKDGKLFLVQKPNNEFPLTPTYLDGFDSPFGNVYFTREKKKIKSMFISVTRARNVEFKKVSE